MLPINKLPEPQGLRNYKLRRGAPVSYVNFGRDDKSSFLRLRELLLEEQKYICAYCGQEILSVFFIKSDGSKEDNMKTEHFVPKDGTIGNDLNYQNLLGCCMGGNNSGVKGKQFRHCDSHKLDLQLLHIQNPSTITVRDNTIRYRLNEASEEVIIFSSDTEKRKELIEILNLNTEYLREERFRIWKKVINRQLGDEDTWTIPNVRKVYTDYSDVSNGRHKEFKDFVLWYLNNWLSKQETSTSMQEDSKKK
jgi:uncharacterized protein (TIGR02646 family)